MTPQRHPYPNPEPVYIRSHGKEESTLHNIANKLILKRESILNYPDEPRIITRTLKVGEEGKKKERVNQKK